MTKLPAQSFQWGVIGGALNSMQTSGQWFRVHDLAVDSFNNVYALSNSGSWGLQVGGVSVNGYADLSLYDIVLTCMDKQGNHKWSKVFGGKDGSEPNSIVTDGNGNVYVTGLMADWRQRFGGDTTVRFPSTIDHPWTFMVKYDSLGNFQWLRQPEPDTPVQNSQTIDVLIDSKQRIHWLCYLRKGHLKRMGDSVSSDGLYVLKLDTDGKLKDKLKLPVKVGFVNAFNYEKRTKFRYDPTRGRYYIGGINDNINPLVVGQDTVKSYMYLAAFDTTGQVVWLKDTPLFSSVMTDFDLDQQGNIYYTGSSGDKQYIFDSVKLTTTSAAAVPFIASISANGKHRWANIGVSNFQSRSYQVVLNDNEVAIAGNHNGLYWNHPTDQDTLLQKNGERSFIARFDTATGDLRGMAEIKDNSPGSSCAWSIASDSRGRYYLGGYFSSKIYLGNQWFTKLGSQRSFYVTQYACDSLQGSLSTAYDSTRGWKLTYRGTPADSVVWQLGDGSPTRQGDSIFHIYQNLGQYPICATVYNNYCGNFSLCDTINVNRINTTTYPTAVPLEVYPNPAQDHLRVWYPGEEPVAYRLLSPAGATVQQGRLQPGAQKLSLTALPPGLYLLQVHSKPVRSVKVVIGRR